MDKAKQDKIIMALITEPTKRQACKKAGISETMLYHDYLKNPDFMQAYRQAIREHIEATTRELQSAMLTSAKALKAVVNNPKEKTQDRITSARIILDYGMRLTEQVDIIERLEDLERASHER